jgi:hypothetical protein
LQLQWYLPVCIIAGAVSPKKPYTLKIDPELLEALREIKERDGIPESEQIRRGIQMWLDSKGVSTKRKPGSTRKLARKGT